MARRNPRRLAFLVLVVLLVGGAKATNTDGGHLDEFVFASCNNTGLEYITQEKRLISCLMHDYDPTVRPALRPIDPVNVTINSVIVTITDLNEKTGVLTTDSWLKQTWVDVQLRWQPHDFGGLKEIRLPVEHLWTPEIVLFNNADESFRYVMGKLVIVNSTGHVTWVPHARLRSFCDVDMTMFPFDTQECKLLIGSWTYEESMVSISFPPESRFLPDTNEWEVMDFRTELYRFSDGVKNYPTVVYTISMKRVSVYYKYALVGPSVILATLTLLLFWIPPDSNERFMLASGILMSLTMMLIAVKEYLPTDIGELPVIASYLTFNFVFLVITISVSILTFNCQYRGIRSGTVPGLIRRIILGPLASLMCVTVQPYNSLPLHMASEENDAHRDIQDLSDSDCTTKVKGGGGGAAAAASLHQTMALERTMDEIRRYLRHLVAKSNMPNPVTPHREVVASEWHQVAIVIDRLVFWIFLFITFVTTVALLAKS